MNTHLKWFTFGFGGILLIPYAHEMAVRSGSWLHYATAALALLFILAIVVLFIDGLWSTPVPVDHAMAPIGFLFAGLLVNLFDRAPTVIFEEGEKIFGVFLLAYALTILVRWAAPRVTQEREHKRIKIDELA